MYMDIDWLERRSKTEPNKCSASRAQCPRFYYLKNSSGETIVEYIEEVRASLPFAVRVKVKVEIKKIRRVPNKW